MAPPAVTGRARPEIRPALGAETLHISGVADALLAGTQMAHDYAASPQPRRRGPRGRHYYGVAAELVLT